MQILLWTKKIIFIGFIQIVLSVSVEAEVINNNSEKSEKKALEVNVSVSALKVDNSDGTITIPKLKNVEQRRTSNVTPFKPNITKAENKYIPTLADAVIFANYDEDLPAVVNYYTYASEEEIITFYQSTFEKALKQERKRGRLTLSYNKNDKPIIVVISQQDNKYQVDVMMTYP
jgi:hypothetical protein